VRNVCATMRQDAPRGIAADRPTTALQAAWAACPPEDRAWLETLPDTAMAVVLDLDLETPRDAGLLAGEPVDELAEIVDLRDVPLDVCLDRNERRAAADGRRVDPDVIRRMHTQQAPTWATADDPAAQTSL
jgi:hypothetical protein